MAIVNGDQLDTGLVLVRPKFVSMIQVAGSQCGRSNGAIRFAQKMAGPFEAPLALDASGFDRSAAHWPTAPESLHKAAAVHAAVRRNVVGVVNAGHVRFADAMGAEGLLHQQTLTGWSQSSNSIWNTSQNVVETLPTTGAAWKGRA